MTTTSTPTSTTTPLPLIALLLSNGISMCGNAMALVAIPWFVLETRGSVTDTAITGAAGALPIVIAAVIGGVFVDRLGHKRASVYADIASGVAVALIPILYMVGWLSFPLLLLFVFFGALLDAPGVAARGALMPDLAQRAGWRLETVNSIAEVVESGSVLVGPLLAGILIAIFSAGTVLLFNAASFALSALLILLLVPHLRPTHEEADEDPYAAVGIWTAFREGVRYVWQDGPLRAIFGSAIVLNFLLTPFFGLLLPVYMNDVAQSATGLGAVIAAFGGGGVAGAVVYGAVGHRWSRRVTFLVGVVAIGAGVLAVGFLPPVPLMVAAMFLAGLIAGPNGPLINTITQERSPVAMRGRILSIVNAMCYGSGPLGFLVAGLVVTQWGIGTTILVAGALFMVTGVVLIFDRGLHDVDIQEERRETAGVIIEG